MAWLLAKRDKDWIACVDFGTALSKLAMVAALDRSELGPEHIKPLAIAVRPEFAPRNPYLLPSIVFVDDNALLFGQDAEEAALRVERSGRQAFTSPKQYLSTHDLDELDHKLPREIDPTGKYTARSLLTLFLAHMLERAGHDAAQQKLPWPTPLRIARPAWKEQRGREGEKTLKNLVRNAFALVDQLGAKLAAKGGVPHKTAQSALSTLAKMAVASDEELFQLDGQGRASVLEATAVAAGSIRHGGRRVVAVADIGGGTSDFGAFMTGLARRNVLAEIAESSGILREAGDVLDMHLRRYILAQAGLLEDDAAARGVANRLRARARSNKEILFNEGQLSVEIGDDILEVTRDGFLADEHVAAFSDRLRSSFNKTLSVAVFCAREHSQPGGDRTRVEIMLTGGGHALPMVRALYEDPSVPWTYADPAPDLADRPGDVDFQAVRRQLAVAIGGAVRDLPVQTAPVRQVKKDVPDSQTPRRWWSKKIMQPR
jgi:molecular chaperone DnaK (HSP70)